MRIQKRQFKSAPGDYMLTILPLATAKSYLFIDTAVTDQDAIITALIKGGIEYIENGLDYPIDTSSIIYQYYDAFPSEGYLPIWHRYIKTTDLVVEYWDGSAWAVFASTNYRVSIETVPPKVFLKANKSWPDLTDPDSMNMVRIGFKVDTAHSFFYGLTRAAFEWVASRYENKEGTTMIPSSVTAFIEQHKLHS
jgi:hypothetical protein